MSYSEISSHGCTGPGGAGDRGQMRGFRGAEPVCAGENRCGPTNRPTTRHPIWLAEIHSLLPRGHSHPSRARPKVAQNQPSMTRRLLSQGSWCKDSGLGSDGRGERERRLTADAQGAQRQGVPGRPLDCAPFATALRAGGTDPPLYNHRSNRRPRRTKCGRIETERDRLMVLAALRKPSAQPGVAAPRRRVRLGYLGGSSFPARPRWTRARRWAMISYCAEMWPR